MKTVLRKNISANVAFWTGRVCIMVTHVTRPGRDNSRLFYTWVFEYRKDKEMDRNHSLLCGWEIETRRKYFWDLFIFSYIELKKTMCGKRWSTFKEIQLFLNYLTSCLLPCNSCIVVWYVRTTVTPNSVDEFRSVHEHRTKPTIIIHCKKKKKTWSILSLDVKQRYE